MLKIKIKSYRSKSGGYTYMGPPHTHVTLHQVYMAVRKNEHIEAEGYVPAEKLFVSALRSEEINDQGPAQDTALLNRIIRAGGFIKYVENLEAKI